MTKQTYTVVDEQDDVILTATSATFALVRAQRIAEMIEAPVSFNIEHGKQILYRVERDATGVVWTRTLNGKGAALTTPSAAQQPD